MEADVTQQTTDQGEIGPSLTVPTCNIQINPDDVDITLTGSLVTKIASVLIPLLKNTVIPSMITTIESQVKTLVSTTVDQDLKHFGSQVALPDIGNLTLDYAQIGHSPFVTTDKIFELNINGTTFDPHHLHNTGIQPVDLPVFNTSGKSAQGYVSEYTLNTTLQAAFDSGRTLNITQILSRVNFTLTTDMVGVAIPEIVTKYGKGKPVDIVA